MVQRRIKASEVPAVRTAILRTQGFKCPVCTGSMKAASVKEPVLDHDHDTGALRGVLCRNCNQMEGKVKTCATRAKHKLTRTEWLANLLAYWVTHKEPQTELLHYTHKTAEEKRLETNKKARERRAKLKEAEWTSRRN